VFGIGHLPDALYDAMGEEPSPTPINAIERLRHGCGASVTNGRHAPCRIQRALDEKPDHRVVSRHGHFVFAHFYTPEGYEPFARHAGARWTGTDTDRDLSTRIALALSHTRRNLERGGLKSADGPYLHVVLAIP